MERKERPELSFPGTGVRSWQGPALLGLPCEPRFLARARAGRVAGRSWGGGRAVTCGKHMPANINTNMFSQEFFYCFDHHACWTNMFSPSG